MFSIINRLFLQNTYFIMYTTVNDVSNPLHNSNCRISFYKWEIPDIYKIADTIKDIRKDGLDVVITSIQKI